MKHKRMRLKDIKIEEEFIHVLVNWENRLIRLAENHKALDPEGYKHFQSFRLMYDLNNKIEMFEIAKNAFIDRN